MNISQHLKPLYFLTLMYTLLINSAWAGTNQASVTICDDENLWPPYTFIKQTNEGPKVTGAMVELVDAIFQQMDIEYSLTLSPWKRCLYQVENYSGTPPYEIFINGSFSEERAEKFLISDRVYSSGAAYFYSNKIFPKGPEIQTLSDLKDYSICGVHGFNYEMFQVTQHQLSVSAGDLHAAFRLLKNNRCELLLNAYSVPFGSKFTDKPMIDDSISAKIIEELPHQQFHLFVSRQSPRASYLLNKINDTIQALKQTGQADQIFRQYLPDCGTDC